MVLICGAKCVLPSSCQCFRDFCFFFLPRWSGLWLVLSFEAALPASGVLLGVSFRSINNDLCFLSFFWHCWNGTVEGTML